MRNCRDVLDFIMSFVCNRSDRVAALESKSTLFLALRGFPRQGKGGDGPGDRRFGRKEGQKKGQRKERKKEGKDN